MEIKNYNENAVSMITAITQIKRRLDAEPDQTS